MYGCGKDCLILITFRLPQISCFTPSLKCFSLNSDNCSALGIRPLFQFPHPLKAGPVLLKRWKNRGLFFSLVPLTEFCMVLYILYCLSGTPVCSQLVFCMHFCVWRCVPNVSVERDVLHIHLLLCRLVLSLFMSLAYFNLLILASAERRTSYKDLNSDSLFDRWSQKEGAEDLVE